MVLASFLASGAPLKLELPASKVSGLLVALQITSHHTAFKAIYDECRPVVDEKVKEFYQQYNSTRINWGIGSGVHLALFSIVCIFTLFSVIVLSKGPYSTLAIPGIMLFIWCFTVIGKLNKVCCTGHDFLHRNIRPWEVFLVDRDYPKVCKEPGLFFGIVRKQSLESSHWSPKYTTRLFLWNNLCLSIGEALENIVGEFIALLFNDRVVTAFHEHIHTMFQKEVWVEEPCIRQLNGAVFYSVVFLSLLVTSSVIGLYAFFVWHRINS